MASCFPKQTLLQYFSSTSKCTTGLNTPILYYTTRRHRTRKSNLTKCRACYEKSHSNITKSNAAPATKSDTATSRCSTSHPPTSQGAAPATQNSAHDQCSWSMKRYLQCAKQHKSSSNVTNAVPATKNGSSAIYNARSSTRHPPTSPNAAPATKIPFMINPLEAWNAIYNARSSRRHPPTSPNTAPATKKTSHDQSSWSVKRYLQWQSSTRHPPTSPNAAPATKNCSHDQSSRSMKRCLECAKQRKASSNMLRLPSKMSLQTRRQFGWKLMKCYFHCATDASMIRAWSETDPTIKTQAANPPRNRGYFSR